MSTRSPSLDDLDRVAFRLARTVRARYPHLMTQGFTLAELEERLLPYREVRHEMADGGLDAFERAVLRLITGERGYLQTERELQSACTQALASPSPSLSLVRAWATATVRLTSPVHAVGDERLTTAASSDLRERAIESALESKPEGRVEATACGCRFCGHRLPDRRRMTFCPHCGMDMTKRQCPACSTELDVQWRFCVTCGRGAAISDLATPIRRAG